MRKALQTEKCTTLVDAGRPGFTVQGRSCCHDVSIEHLEGAVARVVYLNFCHFCLLFYLRFKTTTPTTNPQPFLSFRSDFVILSKIICAILVK